MEGKKITARICAALLAASVAAMDICPALAAGAQEQAEIQAMEQGITDQEVPSPKPQGQAEIQAMEQGAADQETSREPESVLEETSPEPRSVPEDTRTGQPDTEGEEPEVFDGVDTRQEIFSVPGQEEGQETPSGIQENGGLLCLDGTPYTGYYLGSDGILYTVTNGEAEPTSGIVAAGTEYYSGEDAGAVQLPDQTLFVEGKQYTGYYLGPKNKMYHAKKGICTLKTGLLKAGASYYSYNAKQVLQLSRQTLYVEGKVYSGYYMDKSKKMYRVNKGVRSLKSGAVKAGAKYYSYNAKKFLQFPKQTLYVEGKVYSGYYMDKSKKMCRVNKGVRSLKTGVVKAGAKYYSYNAKKFLRLPKLTLYVKGKVYTGFYMDKKKRMNNVKKGTRTLATGMLDAGTKYYSYNAKKTLKLKKQALYVEGKVYSGYYLDPENKMHSVQEGTCTLANATLDAGTRYYSHKAKKVLTLPAQTVYVNGKAMEGMSPESLATLQRAQAVVAGITNSSMTQEEKLKACFEYVKTYRESRPRMPNYLGMDWPVVYANDMFVNGTGNCCSYAAAFAYMAKAIGCLLYTSDAADE